MSPEEIDVVLDMKIETGGKVMQDNSVFEGYAACVDSLKDIRRLYTKIRLLQPTARHVVCAYWINSEGKPFYNQDFCNDDEPAAGRSLLNMLLQNQMENRVVFVARKFGGVKMGANRFECYQQAAKLALGMASWNPTTQTHQRMVQLQPQIIPPLNTAATNQQQTAEKRSDAPHVSNKRAASTSPVGSNPRGGYNNKKFNRGSYGNKYQGRGGRGSAPRRVNNDLQQQALNSLRGPFKYKTTAGRGRGWSDHHNKWSDE